MTNDSRLEKLCYAIFIISVSIFMLTDLFSEYVQKSNMIMLEKRVSQLETSLKQYENIIILNEEK